MNESLTDNDVVRPIEHIGIRTFPDGSLVLVCGNDGLEEDLVFASGAMRGDPVLRKQNEILTSIVLAVRRYYEL